MKAAKIFTVLNFVLSGILWLLAILFFALNLSRSWELWQGVGFLGVCYLPVPAIAQLLALVFAMKEQNQRLLLVNAAALLFSVGVTLFSYFVSAAY